MFGSGKHRVVSKFKNVYCDHPKAEDCYSNLRVGTATGEQNYIQANPKFFCYASLGGGGPFVVLPLDHPGRYESDVPTVNGHTSATLNFDWNPFNDHQLATSSEDCTVKIWNVPEGGYTAPHHEFAMDLHGHMRKVTHVKFNPTAENALASVGADHSVKLWDITKATCVNSNDDAHPDLILDLAWDMYGNSYATTCKDKTVRVTDARSSGQVCEIKQAHDGSKSSKLCYLGTSGNLLTVGFTRTSMRQFKIWDPRNSAEPLKVHDIDQAAGVMMPFFDNDSNMLFLAGKGDGAVHYFELPPSAPYVLPLNTYRSTVSARGMCVVPRRGMSVEKCEIGRLLKLTTNGVEPLSFVVPRKSDTFQADLYPETAAASPAHTFDEWMKGSNKSPTIMSMDPTSDRKAHAGAETTGEPVKFVAPVTVGSLQKELAEANQKIAELEKKLAAAGLS